MATKCFIRQLREEVENDNLPRINTLEMDISSDSYPSSIRLDGVADFEIIGNGKFTDSTGVADYGKTLHREGEDLTRYIYAKYVPTELEPTGTIKLYAYGMNAATGTLSTMKADTETTLAAPNKITLSLAEVLQNDSQYDTIQVGYARDNYSDSGSRLRDDVTDLVFNTKVLAMSGCNGLTGDMSNVIRQSTENYSQSQNLVEIHFSQTQDLPYSTDSLIGKKYLYITPGKPQGVTDIKYIGDTRNRFMYANAAHAALYTGSVNDIVDRLIDQDRTGTDDYFCLTAGSNGAGRFTQVTVSCTLIVTDPVSGTTQSHAVSGTLASIFNQYKPSNVGAYYFKFEWDAQGNITAEIITSSAFNSLPKYVPLPA